VVKLIELRVSQVLDGKKVCLEQDDWQRSQRDLENFGNFRSLARGLPHCGDSVALISPIMDWECTRLTILFNQERELQPCCCISCDQQYKKVTILFVI
jgi:hypothetical protein